VRGIHCYYPDVAGGKAKEFVAVVTIADAMAMVFPHEQSKLVALRLLVSPVYSACCILAEKQSRCGPGRDSTLW
jgi:hypothetical protein